MQIFLDYHNRTWFSPPCLIANKIAPDTLKRIEKFVTEDRAFGRPPDDFANLADALLAISALGSGTDYQRTDVALSTMAQAHAAKNQHPDWHPDSVCNYAGGLLDERTTLGVADEPAEPVDVRWPMAVVKEETNASDPVRRLADHQPLGQFYPCN